MDYTNIIYSKKIRQTLCIMHYALLCIMHYALCIMHCKFCSMRMTRCLFVCLAPQDLWHRSSGTILGVYCNAMQRHECIMHASCIHQACIMHACILSCIHASGIWIIRDCPVYLQVHVLCVFRVTEWIETKDNIFIDIEFYKNGKNFVQLIKHGFVIGFSPYVFVITGNVDSTAFR